MTRHNRRTHAKLVRRWARAWKGMHKRGLSRWQHMKRARRFDSLRLDMGRAWDSGMPMDGWLWKRTPWNRT